VCFLDTRPKGQGAKAGRIAKGKKKFFVLLNLVRANWQRGKKRNFERLHLTWRNPNLEH
jgi:hypothetical protein